MPGALPTALPPDDPLKVQIDFGLCQGHGTCQGDAPEVFDVDEDAMKAVLLVSNPPASLEKQVRAAAKYCPTQAIQIEE